jgi:hypothetical protein
MLYPIELRAHAVNRNQVMEKVQNSFGLWN